MGYRIGVREPGQRAVDRGLRSVVIEEDGTPWPIVLGFRQWEGEDSWDNVSFALGEATTAGDRLPQVDPLTLERVAKQYPLLLRVARDALEYDLAGAGQGLAHLSRGRGRAGLTDEFLRRIAAEADEWRRRGERNIATRVADAHQVNRTTAMRWMRKAAERGFINEEEQR